MAAPCVFYSKALDITPTLNADIFDDAAIAPASFTAALPGGAPHILRLVARNAKEMLQPAALRRRAVICKMFGHWILRCLSFKATPESRKLQTADPNNAADPPIYPDKSAAKRPVV